MTDQDHEQAAAAELAPVIVLKGMSLFGGVSVRGPKRPKKRH